MQLLALETSTDRVSLALLRTANDGTQRVWQQHGAGGAQASATLIPALLDLLRQAGLALAQLDAICFGAGPGAFTGLRTACAVAQGLAFGAGVPVLAVNTLHALAEEARHSAWAQRARGQVLALLDARMDEMYCARWSFDGAHWQELQGAALVKPEADLLLDLPAAPGQFLGLAGNVFDVYGARLGKPLAALPRCACAPTAQAMLRLAPALLAAGLALPAQHALPLYVRDKVAQTTAERMEAGARSVLAQA